MANDTLMRRCDTCGGSFQFGLHRYEGKHIPLYDITVCITCWEANWDGWAPHFEEKVMAKLKAAGAALPARNAKGWLPRD